MKQIKLLLLFIFCLIPSIIVGIWSGLWIVGIIAFSIVFGLILQMLKQT